MSNMEEVAAAEEKMNAAKDALLDYIERGKKIERERHQRLVARLKKAQAEFMKAVEELGE